MEQIEQMERVGLVVEMAAQAFRFPCRMDGMKVVWEPELEKQESERRSGSHRGMLASLVS